MKIFLYKVGTPRNKELVNEVVGWGYVSDYEQNCGVDSTRLCYMTLKSFAAWWSLAGFIKPTKSCWAFKRHSRMKCKWMLLWLFIHAQGVNWFNHISLLKISYPKHLVPFSSHVACGLPPSAIHPFSLCPCILKLFLLIVQLWCHHF